MEEYDTSLRDGMILDEDMTQNLRKELKELNERTEKKMTTFAMNEIESIFRKKV